MSLKTSIWEWKRYEKNFPKKKKEKKESFCFQEHVRDIYSKGNLAIQEV